MIRFAPGERVRLLGENRVGEVAEVRHRKGARAEYTVAFADGERRVDEVDLEPADVGLRSHEHAENIYSRHTAREDWPEEGHPDGCFYCGALSHPSDCCTDSQAVDEYWGEESA